MWRKVHVEGRRRRRRRRKMKRMEGEKGRITKGGGGEKETGMEMRKRWKKKMNE